MLKFKTLDDIDVAEKRIIVRADLNVPLSEGQVSDETRIVRLAPTIDELLNKGAAVVVLSHFGRPGGKRAPEDSLRPLLRPLGRALGGKAIAFAEDCIGPRAAAVVKALEPGEIALMENLRFHREEEANDRDFAQKLAQHGRIYVNDAFSAAHRAHASIAAIAEFLPAAAGRLMAAELNALGSVLEQPARPVAAIVGGAKISSKIALLENLATKVDHLAIGGAMANTFLHALGYQVGRSLYERDRITTAAMVMEKARTSGCRIHLPLDVVSAGTLAPNATHVITARDKTPGTGMILDVGPKTVADLVAMIEHCKTLVWNGPLGAFEVPPFDSATNAVAAEAARLTRARRLLSVAGGGDTVAALAKSGAAEAFSYVSTAGGAFLEWLEGRTLPGVAALEAAAKR